MPSGGEALLRLGEPAGALDDDPGLARAGACDHHRWPVAEFDDPSLLVGQREVLALGGGRRRYCDRAPSRGRPVVSW